MCIDGMCTDGMCTYGTCADGMCADGMCTDGYRTAGVLLPILLSSFVLSTDIYFHLSFCDGKGYERVIYVITFRHVQSPNFTTCGVL